MNILKLFADTFGPLFLFTLFILVFILFPIMAQAQQTNDARQGLDAYAPLEELLQITPSDVTVYDPFLRGCIVEAAGDLALEAKLSIGTPVTISVLQGQVVPVMIRRVLATGTTATVVCGR